jgi:hypothetical protein
LKGIFAAEVLKSTLKVRVVLHSSMHLLELGNMIEVLDIEELLEMEEEKEN